MGQATPFASCSSATLRFSARMAALDMWMAKNNWSSSLALLRAAIQSIRHIRFCLPVSFTGSFIGIQNRPQVVDVLVCLPWGHIRSIIDNCKNDLDKALFFVGKTLENNWSRAVLLIQPSSILFSVHPPHPSGAPAGPRRRLRGGRGRARSRHRRHSRGRG